MYLENTRRIPEEIFAYFKINEYQSKNYIGTKNKMAAKIDSHLYK
ncbi:hypothetical protein A33Q_3639 [Indibacter alkaliphilus LW1]|uniref:Uncharacterized protein n=1 Tax=Indibacter alkaliphilus (strain CCUG 57479 / KCTC 22604 / LW1) TaxID=1189612 RepID=S2DV24_INDAL|nr:hypothetical protein A33Q_3639 [Indibacter alkaliphilus LW1]